MRCKDEKGECKAFRIEQRGNVFWTWVWGEVEVKEWLRGTKSYGPPRTRMTSRVGCELTEA